MPFSSLCWVCQRRHGAEQRQAGGQGVAVPEQTRGGQRGEITQRGRRAGQGGKGANTRPEATLQPPETPCGVDTLGCHRGGRGVPVTTRPSQGASRRRRGPGGSSIPSHVKAITGTSLHLQDLGICTVGKNLFPVALENPVPVPKVGWGHAGCPRCPARPGVPDGDVPPGVGKAKFIIFK